MLSLPCRAPLLGVTALLTLAGTPVGAGNPAAGAAGADSDDVAAAAYAVPAVRGTLTTSASSPVGHDNEIMALASQGGRLFAATDQWMSPGAHTLEWSTVPELSAAASKVPGAQTQKVTGFADCAGALYVTIDTAHFRRNDGTLGGGMPRWAPVYEEPPVAAHSTPVVTPLQPWPGLRPVLEFNPEGRVRSTT